MALATSSSVIGLRHAGRSFAELGMSTVGPTDDRDPEAAARAIAEIGPSVLLTGTSLRVSDDRRWWRAAQARGIPSVALLDHWSQPVQRFSVAAPFDSLPDVVTAIDHGQKRQLIELGCPPARVTVTGQPAFDRASRPDPVDDREKARGAWKVHANERVALFVSEPIASDHAPDPPFDEVDVLRSVLVAAATAGLTVVIRPHPREDPARLQTVAQGSAARWRIDALASRHVALAGVDTVVGIGSILLMEAALRGLHVLSFQPRTDERLGDLSVRFPMLIGLAHTIEEVVTWLTDPAHHTLLPLADASARRARAGLPEGATERVRELVRELAVHAGTSGRFP